MNVLIIEDEDLAVRKLRKLITETDQTLVIKGVTGSIEDSVIWLRENDMPDLIFLDIELSDGQSFEIFNQVDVTSYIIFTTSYDETILPAFRLNSFDYLLKPILKDDLLKSLINFHDHFLEEDSTGLPKDTPFVNVQNLLAELKKARNASNNSY